MEKRKAVVWFKEVGKEDVDSVGGKGANLGELVRAQIPVPPGFIVSAQTYFDFVEQSNLRTIISRETSTVDKDNSSELQEAAERIKEAFHRSPMPKAIAEQIRSAYKELGEEIG